jgi:hypothetical protein
MVIAGRARVDLAKCCFVNSAAGANVFDGQSGEWKAWCDVLQVRVGQNSLGLRQWEESSLLL